MEGSKNTIIQFVLENAELASLTKRAVLYRALAEIIGDEKEAAQLLKFASELEAADRKCREFVFHFKEGGK